MAVIDLLSIQRGSVVAPAGCGKTHLVVEAVLRSEGMKPVLVLTHTNAGVAAMRQRLQYRDAVAGTYRLNTLDAWAMRLARTFPMRSAIDAGALELRSPGEDYRSIRDAAVRLVGSGDIESILRSSYSHVIVDEYQDCSARQHRMIAALADLLPVVVLGDPMQAIFDFDLDALADWDSDVLGVFPVAEEVNTPWRWTNAGVPDLGEWLTQARASLMDGRGVDLREAPAEVTWVQLNGMDAAAARQRAVNMARPVGDGGLLIIGYRASPHRQHEFARRTRGVRAVESVEMPELIGFARECAPTDADALEQLVALARTTMSKLPPNYEQRLGSLRGGRARNLETTASEDSGLAYLETPSPRAAADMLRALEMTPGVHVFRPTLLRAVQGLLQRCTVRATADERVQMAMLVRDSYRFAPRSLPKRSMGSTLLLKGLEASVAVVLDADELDPKNLYVAMTRGCDSLVICPRSPVLGQASAARRR